MDNKQEESLDEQYFRDSNWVAYNGGYIHSNNGDLAFVPSGAKLLTDRQCSSTLLSLPSLTGSRAIAQSSSKL
jgi:hypothetical protein